VTVPSLAASRWSCALSPDRNANPPRPRPRSRQGWAVPHAGREDRLVTSCPCRARARRRAAQRPCVMSRDPRPTAPSSTARHELACISSTGRPSSVLLRPHHSPHRGRHLPGSIR
jgi:hypothetical protein